MAIVFNIFGGKCKFHRHREIRAYFKLGPVQEQRPDDVRPPTPKSPILKGYEVLEMQLTATQKVTATPTFKDGKGNPAKVDGAPSYQTDNPAILTLNPSADGLSCEIVATGMIGTANVQCSADADLGPDVKQIILTGSIEVVAGQAVTGSLDFGTPSEQS